MQESLEGGAKKAHRWAADKASGDEGHNPAVGDVIRSSLRRLIQLTREDAADVLRGEGANNCTDCGCNQNKLEGEYLSIEKGYADGDYHGQ